MPCGLQSWSELDSSSLIDDTVFFWGQGKNPLAFGFLVILEVQSYSTASDFRLCTNFLAAVSLIYYWLDKTSYYLFLRDISAENSMFLKCLRQSFMFVFVAFNWLQNLQSHSLTLSTSCPGLRCPWTSIMASKMREKYTGSHSHALFHSTTQTGKIFFEWQIYCYLKNMYRDDSHLACSPLADVTLLA